MRGIEDRYHLALQIQRQISETLNQSTDLHEILQSSLQQLLQLMELETGWIFLVHDEFNYELIAHHKLPPALASNSNDIMHLNESCKDCSCLQRYWNNQLTKAVQSIKCARISDALTADKHADARGLTHHASIPLTVRSTKVGLLNLASLGQRHFEQDELILLESIAYQMGSAVERTRLYQEQSELLVTKERNRLARDLHDSVNQKLFALSLNSKGLETFTSHIPEVSEVVQDIQQLSQEAVSEMQSLIWQLRPQEGKDNLYEALGKYSLRLGLRTKITCDVVFLNPKTEEVFLRICQEALNNVQKHANTTRVEIIISEVNEQIMLEIIDDGEGGASFIPNRFGMTSMQERAEEINGAFTITSTFGQGTKIVVCVKKEDAQHDKRTAR